jgi:[ribosomal protein S5]-alanine N-acetyltransferase
MPNYLMDGIATSRLLFKNINRAHSAQWLPFFEHPDSFKYWIAARALPADECAQWYDKQLFRYQNKLGGMNALLLQATGKLVGHCGLLVQQVDGTSELEIAYSLLPAYQHLGYATEAATACRDYAFNNKLAQSLISIISLSNTPSQNVAQKIGMAPEKRTVYNNNEVYIYRIHQNNG